MKIASTPVALIAKTLIQSATQREINAMRPGVIVANRKDGTLGRCARSTFGISVCYRTKNGVHGQTIGDYPHYVAKHWRIATDEEVRRYFDAN